jgi:hypothetical protein
MVPFGQQTWPPRAIIFSDWLLLKKSSPLKELLLTAMFIGQWNQMKKLYRRSYIDATCQVWFNLAKQFIKPNLAGRIYVRSSIKHLHLVPFGQ